MNPIKPNNQTKVILIIVYAIIIILSILVFILVIINIKKVQSSNSKLIQVHTVQLDTARFNTILEQIKKEME